MFAWSVYFRTFLILTKKIYIYMWYMLTFSKIFWWSNLRILWLLASWWLTSSTILSSCFTDADSWHRDHVLLMAVIIKMCDLLVKCTNLMGWTNDLDLWWPSYLWDESSLMYADQHSSLISLCWCWYWCCRCNSSVTTVISTPQSYFSADFLFFLFIFEISKFHF